MISKKNREILDKIKLAQVCLRKRRYLDAEGHLADLVDKILDAEAVEQERHLRIIRKVSNRHSKYSVDLDGIVYRETRKNKH